MKLADVNTGSVYLDTNVLLVMAADRKSAIKGSITMGNEKFAYACSVVAISHYLSN